MQKAKIIGTGMAVPECVADNHLLARCMNISSEWIFQRTGIKERRVSPDTYRMLLRLAEAPDKIAFMNEVLAQGLDGRIDSTLMVSDLALEASQMALKSAGITVQEIDCIIGSSVIPDYAYPHTACVLQGKLGLTSTPAFSLQQGCAGFIYGLAMADQFIRTGLYHRILVVVAELLSSMCDYTERGRDMAVIFADGAGAVLLQGVETGSSGLISYHLHTDGTVEGLVGELCGSSTYPVVVKKKIDEDRARPRMNGRAVFVHAVRRFREVVGECLEANRLDVADIDLFIFHQANLRIIEAAAELLKIPPEKTYNNVDRYGNTSAASVPICLHEALMEGRIKTGDLILLAAFGAGFSWGAALLRW